MTSAVDWVSKQVDEYQLPNANKREGAQKNPKILADVICVCSLLP